MSAIKPIVSDHSGEWHRERFAEFAAAKAAVGEPTPHMRVLEYMCRGASPAEKIWRAGCYGAGYSLLTAEAIWREWPVEKMRSDGDRILPWLRENWPGIHTRRPRRAVRTPEKMARCLISYHRLTAQMHDDPFRHFLPADIDPIAEYDAAWLFANQVEFFGRYIVIRLLELWRRWGFMKAALYDIRAIGAHSPIRCLMLLWPDQIDSLATGTQAVVDSAAQYTMHMLMFEYDLNITPFAFAALLCEYRAGYEDRHDYPGNQTDEELSYLNSKYMQHWINKGYATGIWTARRMVTDHRYLGELQGWDGIRPEAARSLRDHGVVWDDRLYNYAATRQLGAPILYGTYEGN